MPQILTECQTCHETFLAHSTRARFCGKCQRERQLQQCRERYQRQPGIAPKTCPICKQTFYSNGSSTLCRSRVCMAEHPRDRAEWRLKLKRAAQRRNDLNLREQRKVDRWPSSLTAKERKRLYDRERQRQHRRDAKKRPHSLQERFFTPGSMSQLQGRKFERAVNNYLEAVKGGFRHTRGESSGVRSVSDPNAGQFK